MENGIVINGKFYPAEWITDLVEHVVEQATKQITVEQKKPADKNMEEIVYTVPEVAKMLRKSTASVKRHIYIGLLKAHRVGRPWVITEENFLKYKNAE